MIVRTILISAALGSFALVSAACSSTASRDASRITVVASFYPLAEAAERVGGDRVSVSDLTAPGAEPHDLELSPTQLEAIAGADLVLYVGGGFQPAVQDALADAEGVTVDVTTGLPVRSPPPAEGESGVSLDPHVWLDPALYSRIVGEVSSALGKADPSAESSFASNASGYRVELDALDARYREGLSRCKRNLIVTSHEAFAYLAARYGLRQIGISGIDPEAEPDPAWLANLKDLVQREGVTTIFTETLVSPKVAETLAQEAGVTTAPLDPLESLTPAEIAAGEDYVSIMQRNLQTLEAGLGCE